MHVFVINTENALDRKDAISKNLSACGYENVTFFKAIEPKDLGFYKDLYSENFKFKDGTLSCALSHILLLKKIYSCKQSGIFFILEDDIVVKKSCKSLINLIFNFLNDIDKDWDIVYFSWGTESNTQQIWEGQSPLNLKDLDPISWDKVGKIIDFYFIRKIKKFSKNIRFHDWSDTYVEWSKNDPYKYSSFQPLINQSAYLINHKKIDHILSTILPVDNAIDVKILENFNKLNIYMISPALDVITSNKITSKDSFRLANDYKKDIYFLWPKPLDELSKNYDYTFKIKIHKSLIHNEHINFIRSKSKVILNNQELDVLVSINYFEKDNDFDIIEFKLKKDFLLQLNKKNKIEFIFETFWEKKKVLATVDFFVK